MKNLEKASSEDRGRGRAIFEELGSILNDPEYLKPAKAKPGEIPAGVLATLDARDAQKTKKEECKANFPLCPPEMQAAPSSLLRSALFGVVRRGKRDHLDNVEIAAWGSVSIRYTGQKLTQSDQDIWLACVEACKREGKTDIIISQREIMSMASRKGSNTQWLWQNVKRLTFAGIEVKDGRYSYVGTLIHDAMKDKQTGRIALTLNPKMLALFGGNVTHIDTRQHQALKLDLSKWLHGYVCSHVATFKKPHFIGLEKLQSLCGAKVADMRNFRVKIKKSMDELKASAVVSGWKLQDDVLTLWRSSK